MTLLATLADFFVQYGDDKTYWIAYSGGLDSQVLLFLCHQYHQQRPLKLRAVHVNHHLSPYSTAWALRCADQCQRLGIDYVTLDLSLHDHPTEIPASQSSASILNLEAKAREKRYAAIVQCMARDDVLLTAHHQDDQAETLLLQLFRGAGPKGLAAMPMMKPLNQGWHGRPLLNKSRQSLQRYAESLSLSWIEDESNQNTHYARNYLRQTVLPILENRWPAIRKTLARSASQCAEVQAQLEDYTAHHYEAVLGSQAGTLSVGRMKQRSSAEQRLLLRYWFAKQQVPVPNAKKLQALQHMMLMAADDRQPCVHWQQWEVRRYRDDLYLMPLMTKQLTQIVEDWPLNSSLAVPGWGVLIAEQVRGDGLKANITKATVRFRVGGERILLNGRRQTLKNYFQAKGVPPWLRDRLPLIFVDDRLVAIGEEIVDLSVKADASEMGWQIRQQIDLKEQRAFWHESDMD